ncbi:MAG: hypothetical protein CMP23_15200 [Rickettsiales bacterium]|nr:hypothetical protein [Rickettsiales bacterium]|tara:strand:+ start:202 stop:684 length:483 start_codon:yes stop_codon:yes gene_type:complete
MSTAKRGSFLDSLNADERKALIACCTSLSFASGQILISEGGEAGTMLFLAKGTARVIRGNVEIDNVGSGAVIGEMALIDPAPRSASVIASSGGTAYQLESGRFQEMLAAGDATAVRMLGLLTEVMCDRLGNITAQVEQEVLKPPEESGFRALWRRIRGAL